MPLIVTPRTKPTIFVDTIEVGNEFHYGRLFELWTEIHQLSPDELDIVIDFHYCEFLNHVGVAFLSGMVRLIESRGGHITFDWGSLPRKIGMNLAQNGFSQEFGGNDTPWDGNSIPLRCDSKHDKTLLNHYLHNRWLGKGWINISPGLQNVITGRVSEIYDNAFMHSESGVGVFSCGQHYPTLQQLHLAIIDFGIGIPNKVRSLPQNKHLSTLETLQWAFSPGNSTIDLGVSRGLGLHIIQEFITANQGSLKIYSNDGEVNIKNGKIGYGLRDWNFAGTFVNIAFQCDESYYCLDSEVMDDDQFF